MIPDSLFEIAVNFEPSLNVRVVHSPTGRSAGSIVGQQSVDAVKSRLKREIVESLLGPLENIAFLYDLTHAGELVTAKHVPTGARTEARPRVQGAEAALLDELMLVIHSRGT